MSMLRAAFACRLHAALGVLDCIMNDIGKIIESKLLDLAGFLKGSQWFGRENELVNLFAHSFLAQEIEQSRIGIEVAVKQLPKGGAKTLVRKDLVIWRSPNETVWINGVPSNDPVAVVEFKVNDRRLCTGDVAWLRNFTSRHPAVVGFSVCGFIRKERGIAFTRVANGVAGELQRYG